MKYRFVLWDFDGTLADTLTIALGIYNQMAAEHGFVPIEDPLAVRQLSMREFLKSHNVSAFRIPMAFRHVLKELRRRAADIKLNDGIESALTEISEHGIAQGVVSSNQTETICECLNTNSVQQFFTHVSGTSRIFGKERRLAKALREMGGPINGTCCMSAMKFVTSKQQARRVLILLRSHGG